MHLTVTALVRYQRGLQPAVDALATGGAVDGGSAPVRYFVPGLLPCGECPPCRRALVGACQARRQVLPLTERRAAGTVNLELPDRFLCAIDDPPGLGPLGDEAAALAGVVASALFAMAAVGAAPGDRALWLGGGAIAAAGAALGRARGLKAAPAPGLPADEPPASHGRSQPLIFVTLPDQSTLRGAAAAAEAGGTMVILSDGALVLPEAFTLPSDSRLLLQGGYHPDLVPEALAALRRNELDLPALAAEIAFEPLG